MGELWEDMLKISYAGSIAKNGIEKLSKERTCDNCGRSFDRSKGGKCMKGSFGCGKENLCPKCMNVCRVCHKVFCDKHIDNHKCK